MTFESRWPEGGLSTVPRLKKKTPRVWHREGIRLHTTPEHRADACDVANKMSSRQQKKWRPGKAAKSREVPSCDSYNTTARLISLLVDFDRFV